ncbi:MAG: hypothetical protein H6Q15_1620 [Bacteroidetes bacterium]|nr:hypothetical protein [Bacteroidota bacterium]
MKKLLITTIFFFFIVVPTFAQDNNKVKLDSIWCFHRFSIEAAVDSWTPIGKLHEFYNPSVKFDAGFGLMFLNKMWIHYLASYRGLNPKQPILLNVNNDLTEVKAKSFETSLGGWLSYSIYQNRIINTEVVAGVTWENVATGIINKKNKDTLSISATGLSLGFNTWINSFYGLNFGIRTIYTYSTFDKSKYIAHPIGGHSFSISLIYRHPRRNIKHRYWF